MSLRGRIARAAGVWEGTYTHLTPDGRLLDRFASRQETRLEGDRWYERIVYRWPDGRSETLDFRAAFDAAGKRMVFDDPRFQGEAFLAREDVLVFPYRWKDRPGQHVVETVVFASEERRFRLWQSFEGTELTRVTVIEERRVAGSPEVWR